jgi:hypothetical protein
MFAVLYFLLIRPQQKQQKAVRQMLYPLFSALPASGVRPSAAFAADG